MFSTVKDKNQWTLRPNSLLRRTVVCLAGVTIVSIGIALCLEGKAGVDPYTAFLQGVSHVTGVSFSLVVPVVNILMLIVVLPFDKSIFGLGTILNFTLVGVLVDYFRELYQIVFTFEYSVGGMLIHLVIGVAFFCLGVSMYITANLGVCPYDGVAPALKRQFPRCSYRTYRVIQDLITIVLACVLIRFSFSLGIIGIGTIIQGFFIGIFVNFFNRNISNRLVGIRGDIFDQEDSSEFTSAPQGSRFDGGMATESTNTIA
jgi:Predicted membrane protein